ncbi:MAG TPA: LysM domain-containing protein [Dyella sp.]|nr:LysM domain-containing protein [Dyella sp.]
MFSLFRIAPRSLATGARVPLLLLGALALAGCASFARAPRGSAKAPAVVVAATPQPSAESTEVRPLGEIINDDLQHGRYVEGEAALRAYLAAHPNDRLAQSMLHQLTADPQSALGPVGSTHVVQPGESYSTLAQRYLGDAQLFLILARYNGSTRPALLQVGEKLRLPASSRDAVDAGPASAERAAPDAPVAADDAAPAATALIESPAARSQRLQRESLALLDAGRETEALARLDAALAEDPGLASDRGHAAALRQQVVARCHQRAIVLYRDQQLAPAIALWDRVLAVDPTYEPALAYRARAQELQRRLKQL